ncbi:hypothetical protein [Streptomyces mirabilis]|uniref:hypothetical protein n=1 Tax=Streptomyces mirabilis TaxID=68239 RepID=UPI0015A6BDF6|nr:hypothetical protein [Streptomyces mirabilis]
MTSVPTLEAMVRAHVATLRAAPPDAPPPPPQVRQVTGRSLAIPPPWARKAASL